MDDIYNANCYSSIFKDSSRSCRQFNQQFIGDFCKKQSPIYIEDPEPSEYNQQSEIESCMTKKTSQGDYPKKIELSDLIEEEEEYSSAGSCIQGHTEQNQN